MISLFRNLGFRWKLTLPILVLAALFGVLGFSAFWAVNNVEGRLIRVSQELLPQSSTVLEADRDMYQALQAERAILAGVQGAEVSEEHTSNLQQASDRIAKYGASTSSAQGKALAADFD